MGQAERGTDGRLKPRLRAGRAARNPVAAAQSDPTCRRIARSTQSVHGRRKDQNENQFLAFRVREGEKVKLEKWPTKSNRSTNPRSSTRPSSKSTSRNSARGKVCSTPPTATLLLIFQAMDAAGKDGAIRHVMSGVNPQGCRVFSFKQPRVGELEHDFLWRTTRYLPERGQIAIFNRSYYEEVLIVRVHPEVFDAQELRRNCSMTKNSGNTVSVPSTISKNICTATARAS